MDDEFSNKIVYKDLVPNGSEILVDNENKKDYVKKLTEVKMTNSI